MEKLTVLGKAVKILEESYICDNCLGRQFAQLLKGYENKERGRIIRNFVAFCLDSGEKLEDISNLDVSNFKKFEFRFKDFETKIPKEHGKCIVCKNLLDDIDFFVKGAKKVLKKIEFNNFLVGTKLNSGLIRREEDLWEKIGINWCEPIKNEINRTVGKELEKYFRKPVEFDQPEIVVLLDLKKKEVSTKINSLFLYGEYNKLVRTIPQTKWPSGKYKNSIEQIIAKPLMKQIGGSGHKFHGEGREDINARCLAWRPFVLEILEPRKRKINLQLLKNQVKKTKKVEIRKLKVVKKDLVEKIKSERHDKTYKVIVKTAKDIDKKDLKALSKLKGRKIYQETPQRVLHRRADKLRKREIKNIKWKKLGKKKLELLVKTEAGTYIKELVSGDKGRTYPSVAELLKTKTECKELDVVKIHRKK